MKPGLRILLVEDDQPLRLSIARGLDEAGYMVDQAGSGPDALALAAAASFDAIILDILLPGESGIAVCTELRARGDRVPILMLTALDGVDQRIAGLDAGADDYLTKPFDFGELLARLRALTRRAGDLPSAELVVGDLVVDALRRTARRGDRDIPLTAREFAVLLYLARNQGRVVSKAELMAQVWHDEAAAYSNIIDVYARRLRRKLDPDDAAPLLTTVRGSGLLLDADAPAVGRGAARPARRRP